MGDRNREAGSIMCSIADAARRPRRVYVIVTLVAAVAGVVAAGFCTWRQTARAVSAENLPGVACVH